MSWSTSPTVPQRKTGPIAWSTDPAEPVYQQKGGWFARIQRVGQLTGSGSLGISNLEVHHPLSDIFVSGKGTLSCVINLKNWRNAPFNGKGLPVDEMWQIHRRTAPFKGAGFYGANINDGLSAQIKVGYRVDFSGGGQFDFDIDPIGGHQYPDGLSARVWERYLYPAYFDSEATLVGGLGYFQAVLADLISSGQLTADVTALNGLLVDLVSDGSLSATTFQIYETLAELLGTGQLSGIGFAGYLKSVGFRGASALVAVIMQSYHEVPASGGIGTIDAITKQIYTVIADFAGGSYLYSEFEREHRIYDDGLTADIGVVYTTQFSGDGSLVAGFIPKFSITANLSGGGVLDAAANPYTPAIPVSAGLTGVGNLTAAMDSGHHYVDTFDRVAGIFKSMPLSGAGALSATVVKATKAPLTGGGTLSATAAQGLTQFHCSYSQSNVYSSNVAADYNGMNSGSADGSVDAQTGMNAQVGNWIEADTFSNYIDHIVIGYDYLNNLPGGWGVTYTEGLTVQGYSGGYFNITTTPTYASSGSSNGLVTIPINTVTRYIRLYQPANAYMAITEFQVWG